MGFGFNLVGFLLLILATVGLLIYFLSTKSKIALKTLGGLWALAIFIFSVGLFRERLRKPIRLTREGIIGEYRIDTNFYPGVNSRWQYEHFRFTITSNDSLYFYQTINDSILKTYAYKLQYASGPPDLWRIINDSAHKMFDYDVVLYRGHSKFYYVIRSDDYGNMFFRKQEELTR